MKTISKITTLIFVISLIAGISVFAQEHNHTHKVDEKGGQKIVDAKKMDKNKDGSVYQCSMNPDQISDKPGDCSKCGMKLEQVSIEDANSNLEKSGMMNKDMNKMKNDKMMKEHKGMMNHEKMMDHDKMMKDGKKMMDHNKMMKDGKNSLVREGIIDLKKIDKNNDGKVFQDMMDWNVISDKAGDCPMCGMKLKEVSIEEAKDNLKKHGYKTK